MRTTAAGNIGLLSSHLKLNRQLLSGTHQRSYRDYHRDLLQERSVRLEDELIQTATTVSASSTLNEIQTLESLLVDVMSVNPVSSFFLFLQQLRQKEGSLKIKIALLEQ